MLLLLAWLGILLLLQVSPQALCLTAPSLPACRVCVNVHTCKCLHVRCVCWAQVGRTSGTGFPFEAVPEPSFPPCPPLGSFSRCMHFKDMKMGLLTKSSVQMGAESVQRMRGQGGKEEKAGGWYERWVEGESEKERGERERRGKSVRGGQQ